MDEQIPQQPIETTAEVTPQPVDAVKLRNREKAERLKGTLERLPHDVKEDMENFMRTVNSNAAKKYMVKKYGETYPALDELSTAAFNQYFKRHKVKISRELELQKQSAPPPPEMLDVIDKITDPDISLRDKRLALTALFNACEARSKLLQERQTTFMDPAYEAILLANRKEQRTIIEKVAILNEQLSKESDKDFLKELEDFTQVLLSSVVNTYKLTHANDLSKFSEFSTSLSGNLMLALKSYKQAKENVKLEKK